jgi:hypothetical protein
MLSVFTVCTIIQYPQAKCSKPRRWRSRMANVSVGSAVSVLHYDDAHTGFSFTIEWVGAGGANWRKREAEWPARANPKERA